ncbi:MAG: L,D-transpeptidase [Prochlorothrix sp.]
MLSHSLSRKGLVPFSTGFTIVLMGQFLGVQPGLAEFVPAPRPETENLTENVVVQPEVDSERAAEDSAAAVPTISHLEIRLGDRRVYAYDAENLLYSYPIAVGKSGWETPTGDFAVFQMIENPAWEHPWNGTVVPPGPGNPLGDRWIGFWSDGTNAIGFHGTPAEELVGQAVSHGCIRMKNNDVRALFEKVTVGTPVFVRP